MSGRIVGVDFSLRRTGVIIRTLDPRNALKSWSPKEGSAFVQSSEGLMAPIKKGVHHLDRIRQLAHAIGNRLQKGDQVIMEDYAIVHAKAAIPICEAGGLFKTVAKLITGYAPILVSVGTLKKYANGKGNSDKNLVMKGVLKRWGYDAQHDDEADAFVLSQIGVDLFWESDKEFPQYHLEAHKVVKETNNIGNVPWHWPL